MSADVLDCVAFISVKLHANGAMSISGNIGDVALSLRMLDSARDAVKNQHKQRAEILIPNRDVDAVPRLATHAIGDLPPEQRGDLPP